MSSRKAHESDLKGRGVLISRINSNRHFLVLLFLILEAGFGVAIFAMPEGNRFSAFVIWAAILAVSALLTFVVIFLEWGEGDHPDVLDYEIVRKVLTSSEFKLLQSLDESGDAPPEILFSKAYPGSQPDVSAFPRRLVVLAEHRLIATVGGSEITVTEKGREFLKEAQKDRSYANGAKI